MPTFASILAIRAGRASFRASARSPISVDGALTAINRTVDLPGGFWEGRLEWPVLIYDQRIELSSFFGQIRRRNFGVRMNDWQPHNSTHEGFAAGDIFLATDLLARGRLATTLAADLMKMQFFTVGGRLYRAVNRGGADGELDIEPDFHLSASETASARPRLEVREPIGVFFIPADEDLPSSEYDDRQMEFNKIIRIREGR